MKVMGRLDPEKRADDRAAVQLALVDLRKTKRPARQADDAGRVMPIWQTDEPTGRNGMQCTPTVLSYSFASLHGGREP